MNAQIATQNSKWLDNTYVSVEGGAATPLTFNGVFPLNAIAGVHIGKWFNPVVGAEIEETVWFGSHYGTTVKDVYRFDGPNHLVVRGNYLGVNTLVNLSNAFAGYRGTPRRFEVGTVLGLGWTRALKHGQDDNGLGAKTGLDLAFNVGKERQHAISIRPAVLWELTDPAENQNLSFDKNRAQLQLALAYTYRFKTSNGTHSFKTYDIGAMNAEIAHLRKELARKPKVIEKVVTVEKIVEVAPATTQVTVNNPTVVFFAQGSAQLTDQAKQALDAFVGNADVVGLASPEGSKRINDALSQRRADAVKAYLESRGITVVSAEGKGVAYGKSTPRAVIVQSK